MDPPLRTCTSGLGDIDELVRTYKSYILRFALVRLRDRDLAESVTQDCFLRAFYSQSLYRGECSVRTWLTTIAINLIRDITRSKERRFWQEAAGSAIDVGDIYDRTPDPHLSPEAHLLQREQLARTWDTVDGLSKPQREIFLMRFACEMKVIEIADITGMNPSTVKSNLHRGLAIVRSQLRRSGWPRASENKVATLEAAKPSRRN
jgi:RNA polymerase sigma-70 factor (ECF subfamily)